MFVVDILRNKIMVIDDVDQIKIGNMVVNKEAYQNPLDTDIE